MRNFEPSRWPAGNPETGYLNCDGSPTKTVLLNGRTNPETFDFWKWNFGKRPNYELFNIAEDPECMTNLANDDEYAETRAALQQQMEAELHEQGDPRILGNGQIFDQYVYAQERMRGFYERYMGGEELEAGWVSPTDFEDAPLD